MHVLFFSLIVRGVYQKIKNVHHRRIRSATFFQPIRRSPQLWVASVFFFKLVLLYLYICFCWYFAPYISLQPICRRPHLWVAPNSLLELVLLYLYLNCIDILYSWIVCPYYFCPLQFCACHAPKSTCQENWDSVWGVVAFGQTLGLTVRWVILTSPHQSVSNHVLMCRRWVSAGFEMHLQKFRRIS